MAPTVPGIARERKTGMHILVVEDDVVTAAKIEAMLQAEQFTCDMAELGEVAVQRGKMLDYDIVVLDLILPDMSGYEVLQQLRAAGVHTPVLILSGLGEVDDKIKGLSFGADDFLTKPFEQRELIARIHAIVRRAKGHTASAVRTGKLLVNLDSRTALVGDQRLHISPKEYAILELLSLRKGTTLTKEFLLHELYAGVDEPDLRIIDVFVCKLRRKLAKATGGEHYIETVRGRGYLLRDPVEAAVAQPA
jgi:two-component system, cell cycle response regulator CtrA